MMFAKLFERPGYGQVLAKLDADDAGAPELRWYAKPPGMGVCSFALGFGDSDEGWDAAERAFERAGDDEADQAGKALFSAVADALGA
jgi:hypothetical protein